ncbi:MAG: AmpG family muropeptide MFS transporter [Burkholderiales bacterium]
MSPSSLPTFLRTQRLGVMLPLGFASGLPLALTAGTLQTWLTDAGVDLSTIGWFGLVGLPYALKFLWAPFMDRLVPPWLGRRRGWMLATQTGLIAGVLAMAATSPQDALPVLGALALMVAFLSASQDIVFDAYRTDLLAPHERGLGAAMWVAGYRVALLAAGSAALFIAHISGWPGAYLAMAGLMMIGLVTILLCSEPDTPPALPATMAEAVWGPLAEFFSRPMAVALIGLLLLYKLGDAFAASLTTPFLIQGLGFEKTDVGVARGIGLGATILGAMVGGAVMTRWSLAESLLVFGVGQALSNFAFVALALTGKQYEMLIATVVIENLAGGMGTAAFVALVMSLCDHRFTATQFALLTSLESLNRIWLGVPAAKLVEALDWGAFFFVTVLASLPGLWVVWRLRAHLDQDGPAGR